MIKRSRAGFTLVEVLIAATLSGMVIAGTMAVFIMGLRTFQKEAIDNQLNIDLELSTERIRQDLRLSSMCLGASMAFYPAASNYYTAISMPIAIDENGDNMLERDAVGKIIWDQTVIYHVRTGTPDELARTVFSPKNQDATPADLYAQLVKVVNGETASAALAGEVYSSRVVFENLTDLKFRSVPTIFDGYSPSVARQSAFNFGSIVIGPGAHSLELIVEGKNDLSSGYKLGVDRFSLSVSDSPREGEYYLTTNIYGYFTYAKSAGSTVAIENMSGVTNYTWSDDEQLLFTPAGVADVLDLSVYNDLWLETIFDTVGGTYRKNTSIKPSTFVSMDKGIAWDAISASSSNQCVTYSGYSNDNIHVAIYGEEFAPLIPAPDHIRLNGCFLRLRFDGPAAGFTNKSARLSDVKFGHYSSTFSMSNKVDIEFSGLDHVEIPAGQVAWSDWVDYVIDEEDCYMVSFIANENSDVDKDCLTAWSSGVSNSWVNLGVRSEIIGITEMEVRYPKKGLFRSGIFDTKMEDVIYDELEFQCVTHPKDDVDVNVRGGTNRTLLDGTWEPGEQAYFENGVHNDISSVTGRYVQYEAAFSAADPNETTAELHDLVITWDGPTGIVSLNMDLGMGPDYGRYTALVDGKVLARGVEVDITIFKDFVRTGERRTVKGILQIVPLNTGK
ncbi:MAG: prepilin-type N-terminal cleavage/methylation domain-containing protein [Kiritimatiellae bacterium]|nr:prepilin-type N-terminal cleavage/methylation domain-containing protein [Kiritimatiellia bacterium]